MEEFLEDTPSIPSDYILYTTNISTAVVDDNNSLFYGTDVLSEDWDTEVYLPPVSDGNIISPHLSSGLMTGFFDISGNGTTEVVIYYRDLSIGTWYKRNIVIVGADAAYRLEDILNAEPNVPIYITTRVYSVAGRLLTKDGGQFSITNGNTWTNSFVNYVPGTTLYRKSVTPTAAFSHVNEYEITIGGVIRSVNVITRLPLAPVFSASSYEIEINENSSVVGKIYPSVLSEGIIEMSLIGDDADFFTIDNMGNINTSGNLDYESPQDDGLDNNYSLSVVASNSEHSTSVPLSVTINDVNETPPLLVDPGLLQIPENIAGSWVINVSQGAGPISYTMLTSLDSSKFTFTPNTRTLKFKVGMDYDIPTDSDEDNVYEVDIVATNEYGSDTLRVSIEITNVIEDSTPNAASYGSYTDVTRGSTFYVSTSLTGVEANAILTVVNGELSNDNGDTWGSSVLYVPGATSVRRSVTASSSYETTLSYSSVVNGVTITASLRTGNTPVTMPSTRTIAADENILTAVANVAATAGYGIIQYEILVGGDSDTVRVDTEGKVYFKVPTDYYAPIDGNADNVYTFTVRGYNSFSEAFTSVSITVLNVILPVKLPTSKYYRFKDTATTVGTIVPILTDDITEFSLTGVDAALFDITTGGVISFKEAAIFETPLDSNADNRYLFQVVYSNSLYSSVCSVRVDIESSTAVVSDFVKNISKGLTGSSTKGSVGSTTTIIGYTF